MGWKITLYDEDGKELVSFNRSSGLEAQFRRELDRELEGVPLFFEPIKNKTSVDVDFEQFWEVDSYDAFYSHTLWIISIRKHPLYKGPNSGPIRVDMWGDPYFVDKPFNHPPPTAADLAGFDIQAARLAMMEEQFYEVVNASNDHPDGYWHL